MKKITKVNKGYTEEDCKNAIEKINAMKNDPDAKIELSQAEFNAVRAMHINLGWDIGTVVSGILLAVCPFLAHFIEFAARKIRKK